MKKPPLVLRDRKEYLADPDPESCPWTPESAAIHGITRVDKEGGKYEWVDAEGEVVGGGGPADDDLLRALGFSMDN